MVFVGVYRATYDYAATAENELSIKDGDLLCILDKGDDDWWTAKKKAQSNEEEEPEGLVPFNYLEEVHPTGKAKALYEYTRQTDEELSFGDEAVLDVYDTSDEDWTLVGSSGEFGFVPANYIEALEGGAASEERPPPLPGNRPQARQAQEEEDEDEAPPPMPSRPRPSQTESDDYEDHTSPSGATSGTPAAALANILHGKANDANRSTTTEPTQPPRKKVQFTPEESEDEAPRLPRRPPSEQIAPVPVPTISTRHVSIREPEPSSAGVLPSPPHNRAVSQMYDESSFASPGGYHLYNIHEVVEVMGKNRRTPITLGINIAKGVITLSPENSPSSQEWTADKLERYSMEGKHVFMDLKKPSRSIDLHAGQKDTAQVIVAALGELAGAARAEGLREVMAAGSGSDKMGKMLYEFSADDDNEVSVNQGEEVIILDDVKNIDWWLVRRTRDGKTGVVPASYVEPITTKSSVARDVTGISFVEQNRREEERLAREASKGSGKVGPGLALPERQSSLTQEGSKRRSSIKSESKKSDKKQFPDRRKVRTWTDRSGGFKVEAEFLAFRDGKLHLHKVNGVKIAVPVSKMSPADIEHVERVTGQSLDDEKSLADLKRSRQSQSGATVEKKPDYDWFDFFLSCGVSVQICERYAQAFKRDEIGEEVMPDISPDLLRRVGLKEGDILRVMKFLDNKYNRNRDLTPTSTGGLFTGPGGALKQNATKKSRPTPTNPAKDSVDEKAFESKTEGTKAAAPSEKSKVSLVDGFDDDAWEPRASKTVASPTVASVSSAPETPQPAPPSLVNELAGLNMSSPPLQPSVAPQPIKDETSPVDAPKPGAAPSLFEQLAKSSVANPQQTGGLNVSRQRPIAPQQTNTANAMIQPPPVRAVSAPQSGPFSPPGQQQGMQPLAPQLTGYPMMQTQPAPMGQSMHELNQQKQWQAQQAAAQQRLMSQPTGMGYGMGFQGGQHPSLQQALVNGQQAGSPFADPGIGQYQSMMPMATGMGQMQPMHTGMPSMYQQPQQTGVNAFLPPALVPQRTGLLPQQTGMGMQPMQYQATGFGMNGTQQHQQAPPVPSLPPHLANIPVPPIPQQAPTPAPLIPQRTGPAPPVRFGVQNPETKKLVPQPTGKRANLAAATPQNPFGF